jgi:phenylpropionate dioxygenase-like ring-hydroxylating dioxygenase large terminal subunit
MILRNYWYVAARAEEVTQTPLGRVLCEQPIVLFRGESGRPAALRDLCSHRRAPLSKGRVVGEALECGYHGLTFDACGRCIRIPGQETIPDQAHIDAFAVAERWGLVWIWLGSRERADPAAIPHKPWRADPAWNAESVHYYHVNASHLLMTDNLLDLAHVAYIHADTIGFDAAALEHDPLVTEVDGLCVRNTRVLKGIDPAPAVKGWGGFTGKVDRISISEWTPPCYTAIQFCNRDAERALEFRIDHLLTPESASSHHYWVLVARNFRIGDDALTLRIHADNDRVAAQDLDIVEAQQRMIALAPGSADMPIRQDRGLIAAHRILQRLHGEERADAALRRNASASA